MNPPPPRSWGVRLWLAYFIFALATNTIEMMGLSGEDQELQGFAVLYLLAFTCYLWRTYWRERDEWKLYRRWTERSE